MSDDMKPVSANDTKPAPVTDLRDALGFRGAEDADLVRIPRARLAQGLTPEVLEGLVQPGSFILPGGEAVSELVGTITAVRKSRVLWNRSEGTAEVQCSSQDGETGYGDPGGPCNECPMAQWTDKPPACTLSYEFLLLQESGAPVTIVMSTRSASQTIGMLNLALRAKGEVPVTIRSQLVQKGSKRFYVPVAEFRW